ncbi:MAG: hybrid sensor histidine kinase/response regulator, partial [Gammaproteobacteria bacterium]
MREIKVLVVEDEAITAMDLQRNLQKLGYKVPAIVSSGEEAIAAAKKFNPDLIVMDIVLKGNLDGIAAANEIVRHFHIPIVFITAYADTNTFDRAKFSIPYGYLTKPFEYNDLRIAVALALYKRQMEVKSSQETTRLKSEFLANMSHELRTPLNGIIGFAEIMHEGIIGSLSPDHQKYVKDILTSSYHLLRIIDDILDLSKLEYGGLELRPELLDLKKLSNEIKNIFSVPLKNKNIRLVFNIDPKLEKITLDLNRFKQVLCTLIFNGIKFSPDNEKIEVNIRPEDKKRFRVEIVDKGIGIHEDDIHKLFIPFQQLDESFAKKYQGVGLGLALSRLIVEAQCG